MGDDSPAAVQEPRYRAFISYSHADTRFAGWLHRKLESWRMPDKTRLAPVFIDRAELAAGSDLSAQVRDALAGSAALIVACSANARASRWVRQEIQLFRELHPDRPVLAALIDGEPDDAFPDLLLETAGQKIEPLAADFRKGQDGRRLGLLKLVAGLTGQPLDRLVQRDAQNRQRRVMAVTAGALLLVLILSASLIIALRARAEAERQRSEAEGLVEFMLTDLRDRLKGVGRLDVMDAVNERVSQRYRNAALPQDALVRRARLLQAMAEDDYSTKGRKANAMLLSAQALEITQNLIAAGHNDYDTVFAHAQSHFWMGYGFFLDREKSKARPYFEAYHSTAKTLYSIRPNDTSKRELAYAQGNLCSLALLEPVEPQAAYQWCRAARASAAEISTGSLKDQLDLANRLGWEADASFSMGKRDEPVRIRTEQVNLTESLARKFPADARAQEAVLVSYLGLANLLFSLRRNDHAYAVVAKARAKAAELARQDPNNRNWEIWGRDIRALGPKK